MAAPDAFAIDVCHLNKSFGRLHAVKDLSMKVREGEIMGFLGPNGSGKTTTLRMMCGLLTPDSGSGACLGFDILRQSAEIKRQVGYMTQTFSYYDDLTVEENLAFVARMYGMKDRHARVRQALEELSLSGRRKQLAGALSGGLKQRMALAACLLHRPRLLLLDEPTAGVDPKERRDFWDHIHDLAATGVSVLVSTHYMDEAERCQRLAYILRGRLLAEGTPRELVAQSQLATWQISGPDLLALEKDLRALPDIEQVAAYGATLHVSAVKGAAAEASLKQFLAGRPYRLDKILPGIEDVFIHLMSSAS